MDEIHADQNKLSRKSPKCNILHVLIGNLTLLSYNWDYRLWKNRAHTRYECGDIFCSIIRADFGNDLHSLEDEEMGCIYNVTRELVSEKADMFLYSWSVDILPILYPVWVEEKAQ